MLKIQFIKRPSPSTINMLARRSQSLRSRNSEPVSSEAVGLVQGPLADMVAACDIAEKTSGVMVEEIQGICPQHFAMIAIFGDTSAVAVALIAIGEKIDKKRPDID
ncbi:BMC domain-containing protein [Sinanaerobacter chloroacetimidivorans]|uniref:BMC domain-containing protein n=1 Tax=Sinanaerobacter chloroacetimidivorans TaxID=2818044 RepID=UPI0029CA024B|nr:BMC domain-containing protein [Sinanaerobacter chloroacetimidivorans]